MIRFESLNGSDSSHNQRCHKRGPTQNHAETNRWISAPIHDKRTAKVSSSRLGTMDRRKTLDALFSRLPQANNRLPMMYSVIQSCWVPKAQIIHAQNGMRKPDCVAASECARLCGMSRLLMPYNIRCGFPNILDATTMSGPQANNDIPSTILRHPPAHKLSLQPRGSC